jgi:hypothetical protein
MTRRIALLMFLIAHAATAQVGRTLSPKRLNGEWTGTLALDNSSPRVALVFQLTDSAFAGKVYTDGQLMGDMQGGSVTGDTVHFKIDRLDFTGVVTGERMSVALIVYNGSTRNFSLTKTPELPKPPARELADGLRGNRGGEAPPRTAPRSRIGSS